MLFKYIEGVLSIDRLLSEAMSSLPSKAQVACDWPSSQTVVILLSCRSTLSLIILTQTCKNPKKCSKIGTKNILSCRSTRSLVILIATSCDFMILVDNSDKYSGFWICLKCKNKFLKGKVQNKKNEEKKLTNVSFMYVCVAGNGEMLVIFLRFFPQQ